MARQGKPTDSKRSELARLSVPRVNARTRLLDRLERGKQLMVLSQRGISEDLKTEYGKWNDFNNELLKRIFTNDQFQTEYDAAGYVPTLGGFSDYPITELRDKLACLESIVERLDLVDEPAGLSAAPPAPPPMSAPSGLLSPSLRQKQSSPDDLQNIFVVHGRDEEAKAVVARFLEKLNFKPIILHEQPSVGRTVIEKFEANANVAFAVVLLTPDDVGGLKAEPEKAPVLKPRGRQNVVLELGYFFGRLGRSRVMALTKGEVELPSDYVGVVFTQMDAAGAWKVALAQELKAAGLPVDLNRMI